MRNSKREEAKRSKVPAFVVTPEADKIITAWAVELHAKLSIEASIAQWKAAKVKAL